MAGTIAELKQLMGKLGSQPAGNTAPNMNGWQQTYPGQIYPATPANLPGANIVWPQHPKYVLSDFDIELMAACISNKHPVVDGQSHCFCTLKRLERGISKD